MAIAKPALATPKTTQPVPIAKAALAPAAKPAVIAAASVVAKIDPGQRQRMIAEAAYYLAEKRGFTPGNQITDWAEAEKQIDAKLKAQ